MYEQDSSHGVLGLTPVTLTGQPRTTADGTMATHADDIGNRPTAASIGSYVSRFGDDYYSFVLRDHSTFGIVVNTSLWRDAGLAEEHQRKQLAWFKNELVRATDASRWSPAPPEHIFVFSHHPWFLSTENERDQYFNMPTPLRIEALSLMAKHRVKAAFAGHYHRNMGGFTDDGRMEMITTAAVGKPLGVDACGFRLVKVFPTGSSAATVEGKESKAAVAPPSSGSLRCLDHRYFELGEMPARVELTRASWGAASDAAESTRQRQREEAFAAEEVYVPPSGDVPPGAWPAPELKNVPPAVTSAAAKRLLVAFPPIDDVR